MTETGSRLLGGRYEIGDPLGTGGMAEVYCGRDTRLGRDVAIKLLRPDLAGDPTFIARFRREAQAAASLNHPNVVSVYDTGDEAGVPYIVMEYVEGRTLREILRDSERMLPQRALEIVADVCLALDYSHKAGIVHRDIKPGNVMLTNEGVVKVMDFGIARAITSSTSTMTQTAAVIGTAQYLSPEQARGEHVDARSDIYSTGCLLYEMLTRTPPFTGDSPVAVAYQHVREDPERPSSRSPGLDPAVDAVVLKAMAKNPGNRYQTAGEMRGDLLRAAAGRPVMATPILDPEATSLSPMTSTMIVGGAREPQPPPRRVGRTVAYVALALATVTVFILAAFLVRSLVSGDNKHFAVPNVIGKTEKEARAELTARGLVVAPTSKTAYSATIKAGSVVDQSPAPPIEVSKGSEIVLTISRGIRTATLPGDLVGKSFDAASAELTAAGFKPAHGRTTDGPQAKDTVVGMTPAPGTVAYGSTVTLDVASGLNAIPQVMNLTQDAALKALHDAGFATVNIVQEANDAIPAGTVIGSTPSAGSSAPVAEPVTLQVSSGPVVSPTPTPTDTGSPTPSDTPSDSTSPPPF